MMTTAGDSGPAALIGGLLGKDLGALLPIALAFLDGERQQTAKLLGVAESAISSLPRAPIPTDLDAWIAEVTTPSHLAAFRWWGTCAVGPVGEPQV